MVFQNVPSSDQHINSEQIFENLKFDYVEFHNEEIEDTILEEISQEVIIEEIINEVMEENIPHTDETIPINNNANLDFGTIYIATTRPSVAPHLNFSSTLNTTSIITEDVNVRSALNLTLNLTASGDIDLALVPIDYVLVLDWSGSVGRNGWQNTVNWGIGFINSLKSTDRISIIRFSTDAITMHSLEDNQHRPSIINLLRSIGDPRGWTSTKDAVNATLNEFKDHSDRTTPKFMFMVTDGVPYGAPIPETSDPNDREDQDPCPLAQNLRDEGIATLILGVGGNWNQQVIECLVENPETDLLRVQDYNSLGFDPEDLSVILGNLANTTAFNINLTMSFDSNVNLLEFSVVPTFIVGNDVTWSFDKMKDNETILLSVILDVVGEGTVPVYTGDSTLEYEPVNESRSVENLDPLNVLIIVEDVDPPILAVPPDITVEAQSITGTVVFFAVVAYDLKDGNLVPECNPLSGTEFPIGDTVVTCTASDYSDNMVEASFVITVVDNSPPILTLPADITVHADGPAGTIVEYSTSAIDLVDGLVDSICTPSSGSIFALGTTHVSCEASDSSGNSASGSFSVIVVDTEIPIISSPDDVTILEGINEDDVVWELSDDFPDYYELFLDNVLIISDTWISGDLIEAKVTDLTNGTYIYRIVVYDSSGNFAVDEVQVIVLTISDQFERVRELISSLGLKWSKTKVLLGKLELAIKDFEIGRYDKAVKHLNTLVKNLIAFTKCKDHLQDDVDLLIDEINNLIKQIDLFEQFHGDNDACQCHGKH